LQLYGLHPARLGSGKELLSLLKVALMVVTDFSNDVARLVVANNLVVDFDFS
jgi:hypothetical protein